MYTYGYNALNQLIRDTDGTVEHSYEYDNRGNLVRMLENGNLKHAYEFGAMNRMTKAVDNMGNVAEYRYNGLGHRTGMRQGVANREGMSESFFLETEGIMSLTPEVWNRETEYILDVTKSYRNLLQKEEQDGVQSYIWDSETVFLKENGESYNYLNDMQGSAMCVTDHRGACAAAYAYDEFGTDLYGNQGQFQPFGYTGYRKDEVAGTYYAQAREYDARAGRFVSEDIIKGTIYIPDSVNQYLYCQNQPIDYIDLDGLSREDARKYMEKYATDEKSERNPDYPSFGTNCANYVSQSLAAGGVTPVKYKWFCTSDLNATKIEKAIYKLGSKEHQVIGHNEHYNDMDKDHDVLLSDTWNNANAQYHYFSNSDNGYINGDVIEAHNTKEIKDALKKYDIQTGDLVYWSIEGEGYANHATIISKVDESNIYYAGNTSPRFDEQITDEKFKNYKSIYIVRLQDEMFDEKCPE